MTELRVVTGVVLDEAVCFSLGELSRYCDVSAELLIEMVDEGVLVPEGRVPSEWRFRGPQLARAQVALRLAEDLRVNLPGAALALELMDELEQLRALRRGPAPLPGEGYPDEY